MSAKKKKMFSIALIIKGIPWGSGKISVLASHLCVKRRFLHGYSSANGRMMGFENFLQTCSLIQNRERWSRRVKSTAIWLQKQRPYKTGNKTIKL